MPPQPASGDASGLASGSRVSCFLRRACIGFVAFLCIGLVGRNAAGQPQLDATANNRKVVLALYSPTLPLLTTEQRLGLARRLAAHLSRVVGQPVDGQVFGRASDLDAAVKRGRVAVILADAPYLARRPGRFEVVASVLRDGRAESSWVLVTRQPQTLAELEGKAVAIPASTRSDVALARDVMLAGELPKRYFRWVQVPTLAAARATLELGKCEAALLPRSGSKGLHVVLSTLDMPLPQLAVVRGTGENEALNSGTIQRGIERFADGSAGIAGFAAGGGSRAKSLLAPVHYRPLLSQTRPSLPAVVEILHPGPLPWKLQPASALMPAPMPAP